MHGRLVIWVALVAVAACSGGAEDTTTSTTTTPAETTTTSIPNPFLDIVEAPSNFSAEDVVDVVGLPLDEQAWVGSFPADDVTFFGELWEFDRLDAGLIAAGEAASYLGGPVWERVGREGREPGYFLQENTGVIGRIDDATAEVADLTSDSVDDLGMIVAEALAGAGLEPIQILAREFGGRELYYDLIGSADELTRGYRIKIITEEDGALFRVISVERSLICVHGTDETGDCI
jgi:hypothetical protein